MKKEFTTKKDLYDWVRRTKKSNLDNLIVIQVRANVLMEIWKDIKETDSFWGRREKGFREEIRKLKYDVKRVKKERKSWRDSSNVQKAKGNKNG